MSVMSVLTTNTNKDSPLDSSSSTPSKPAVSSFITIQSFTNFAAMTGAITAAWHAMQILTPAAAATWVPYLMAMAWGAISLLISIDGLKKSKGQNSKLEPGTVFGSIFVAFINSLVLAGAVVGTNLATT